MRKYIIKLPVLLFILLTIHETAHAFSFAQYFNVAQFKILTFFKNQIPVNQGKKKEHTSEVNSSTFSARYLASLIVSPLGLIWQHVRYNYLPASAADFERFTKEILKASEGRDIEENRAFKKVKNALFKQDNVIHKNFIRFTGELDKRLKELDIPFNSSKQNLKDISAQSEQIKNKSNNNTTILENTKKLNEETYKNLEKNKANIDATNECLKGIDEASKVTHKNLEKNKTNADATNECLKGIGEASKVTHKNLEKNKANGDSAESMITYLHQLISK